MPGYSFTKKGGVQYVSTLNPAVSFLHSAAAQRSAVMAGTDTIVNMFRDAYNWRKDIAVKLALWLRDPRQGAGEKEAGKKVLVFLEGQTGFVSRNVETVAKYTCWKDLLVFSPTPEIITSWALAIKNGDRLAAKWAPRLHSKSDPFAKLLRDSLEFSNKQYRKLLLEQSHIVEHKLCSGNVEGIAYSTVPSQAMRKYHKAFARKDGVRFLEWKTDKSTKANASVLYPYQVIQELRTDPDMAQKHWENLPNFIKEGERILPMIDVSGSMNSPLIGKVSPMAIAISLGMYVTERQVGSFRNMYLTFDTDPLLLALKGSTLLEKFQSIDRNNWGGTTNLERAYDLILDHAVAYQVTPEHMPTMFVVISDMQFDIATSGQVAVEDIRRKYEGMGFKMPKLVFWNVHDEQTGAPATVEDKNVALISGFSPAIMKAVLACDTFDPLTVVYEAIKPYEIDTTWLPDRL